MPREHRCPTCGAPNAPDVDPRDIIKRTAAARLAIAILRYEADLLQLEQPGDFNEGLADSPTTTIEQDTWKDWVALAKKACGEE